MTYRSREIERAKQLALSAHGELYYREHLLKVYEIGEEHHQRVGFAPEFFDIALGPALLLHDTIEDTTVTRELLIEEFNVVTAGIVYSVTDEPGRNRREQFALTAPKIALRRDSTFTKLCDRLANARRRTKNDMYRKEHPAFSSALRHPDRMPEMEFLWELVEKELDL